MPIYKRVNKDFFKKWTPEMAYVLGFFAADGNVVHTNRDTWFWSLQINDENLLKEIRAAINSSHTISPRKKKGNKKTSYRLQIGSKYMCKDLINLGLTERKSKTISLPQVPQEYFGDFLRGYFDGDGGVWVGYKNKTKDTKQYTILSTFTSGSERFLVSLKDILFTYGILGGSLVQKERGFDLKYSVKDSLILYKIMYNDKCSLFLERKRVKFEKYLKMRS